MKILITSGPTREYLDPVRYISNASSGQMGAALASAALQAGSEVLIISGPVAIEYPSACEVVQVETTDEMLSAAKEYWPQCDGVIGAAAPCDWCPEQTSNVKLRKNNDEPLNISFLPTKDILGSLSREKEPHQWMVSFALETESQEGGRKKNVMRALEKMKAKKADWIVLNGPQAINATHTNVEIFEQSGKSVFAGKGSKQEIAEEILRLCLART